MSDSSFIIARDPAIPLLHLSLAGKRGSLQDPEGKEGTARLLVRLMRRSVKGMTAEEIEDRLDSLGATFGGDVTRSSAGFHGGCIARSRHAFFDLATRMLAEPSFDEAEFLRLKEEALAEWVESLDNDSAVARRFFTRGLFRGHPYGRLSGGTAESLARVQLEDVRALYEVLFCRQHLEAAFAGDVTEGSCISFGENLLAALPRETSPEPPLAHPEGPQGRSLTFVDKPDRSQTQILIGCLGSHPTDDDHTALYVGHTIFGGTFSGRLSREVRGKRGWSYGAYSDLPFDKKRQAFSLWTFPQASDAASCIRLELDLLKRFIERGVSKTELSAAKKYLTNSHVFASDTAAKRASLALDERLYDLPPGYHEAYLDRVSKVTCDDVQQAIKPRLSAENLHITVLGTHSAIFTAVRDSIENLAEESVVAFDQKD